MANSLANKIKVVALDFDGVLTSLDINWKVAIRHASKLVGYDVKSLISFYENNFNTPDFKKVSDEMEKIEMKAVKTSSILPCVKEALKKISEKHIEVYIVSMQPYQVIKEFNDKNEISSFFESIITREKYPSKKDQIGFLIEETGLSPGQLLLVDDSKRNINVCSELGITCFLFDFRKNEKESKKNWNRVLNLLN